MAILRGFPPSNSIGPGIEIAEKDNTFVLAQQSFHRGGLIGFASKGPINVPTLISNKRQLNITFGYPHPDVSDPYLIYAAEQYLQIATELYVVRVADESSVSDEAATTATVDIPASGSQIVITSDVAGPYSFPVDSFFRWKLNGVEASKSLIVYADDNREGDDEGVAYTATELAAELNDQLVADVDGIEFFVSDDDQIGVKTVWAYGPESSLEFLSVKNSILGSTLVGDSGRNVTGLGQLMTPAKITSGVDTYGNGSFGSDWNFEDVAAESLLLNIVVDGTDSTAIDGNVQEIDLSDFAGDDTVTTADLVNAINLLITDGVIPGGFVAVGGSVTDGPELEGPNGTITVDLTEFDDYNIDNLTLVTLHSGRGAKLLVKSNSPALEIFDFATTTNSGASPEGDTDATDIETLGLINGGTGAGDVTFVINADSAGIEGNYTVVRVKNEVTENTFSIQVFNNDVQVESFGNLTKNQASTFYVESFLSLVSDFVKCEDMADIAAGPKDGDYVLAGGSDGIPSDADSMDDLLIGNNIGYTGIYSLSESEQFDIDLIAVPGHPSTAVIEAMLDLCENYRQDCMAIIDPPFGLSVKEIIQWQNGAHPLNSTRFDSDFAALYWPWVKIRDTYNRVDVWVPPSGSIMAVYARSDQLAQPWFAPAGVDRGIVPGILDVYNRPTATERDDMYGNRNAINPIVQFADVQSFLVWGQKTLQRRPTALDRVNVRRMLFVAEKRIRAEARVLLFDPHDELFTQRFIDIATRILTEIQIGRGLSDFIIDAGDQLNNSDVIDRNEFRANIGIQPTHAVEFMFFEFSIHRTGSFTENADTF
jgi:hypothetical protein